MNIALPRYARIAATALTLLLASAGAQAALRIDLLVFSQTAASGDGLGWTTTLPLPPCHAVQLREGAGAEAAFASDGECVKKPGVDPVYVGYSGTGAAALTTAGNKLKTAGNTLLVNRGWRQSGDLSPVLLKGGKDIGGRPEVSGTLAVTTEDKYVSVTLDLVLTRLNAASGQPEYLPVREVRKMKTGEPHYLDHPLLGAIVQVVDTEQPGK
jgi:hypothetical protein